MSLTYPRQTSYLLLPHGYAACTARLCARSRSCQSTPPTVRQSRLGTATSTSASPEHERTAPLRCTLPPARMCNSARFGTSKRSSSGFVRFSLYVLSSFSRYFQTEVCYRKPSQIILTPSRYPHGYWMFSSHCTPSMTGTGVSRGCWRAYPC